MGSLRLRAVLLLLTLAALPVAAEEEANPVQPRAAATLADRDVCVAHAAAVGRQLLRRAKKTKAGLTFGNGPYVYDGDAGVALLFAGLHRATRDKKWLEATRATLREAMASAAKAKSKDGGLYTGRAGVGEACVEAYWATGDKAFLDLARKCAKGLGEFAATDIIFGAAGGGVFLLNLHRATGDKTYLKQARQLGEFLAATAIEKDGRAHWPLVPRGNPRVYLGFSHGAAGVGYFLLHLGRRTDEAKYKNLAEAAARFVLRHEEPEGKDGAHWWRTVPKSSNFQRIQWCHGAPGMGLFFNDLHRHLKKEPYEKALQRCLATTKRRGRNARKSGCQCHGVAGNAELFLEVYAANKDNGWLKEARHSASALLQKKGDGFEVKMGYAPSYMLGLSGIGHFFLRLADPKKTPLPMMIRD